MIAQILNSQYESSHFMSEQKSIQEKAREKVLLDG